MDYQKLILRIKCPEIRECPFQEPMSCTKCRNAVGEDSVFAIKELLSRVEELEAKNRILEEARENANAACSKWEGLYWTELEKKSGKAAWIRVEDRLPERFCPVIVCRKDGKVEAGQKDVGDWWRVYGTRIKTVSYWMPLPEPPKKE